MKKIILYALSALFLLSGCNDFGDVNNDPENFNPSNFDYKLMFTEVQAQMAGSDWDIWRSGCIYSANMMQHTSSPDWSQGVFYTWSEEFNAAYWDNFYSGGRAAIRNIIEVLSVWQNNPAYNNEYQYARVMKAYLFQRMTDLYGDVPYFDAGKITSNIFYPKYDSQESIYDDLLKELDEVNTALSNPSTTNVIKKGDVIYEGNTENWRKFANSLMLRVAMRLIKVDPAKAATWANKAFTNGIFTSATDNAILKRKGALVSNDSAEPYGKILSNEDPQAFFVSEYFIDALKKSSDPRIHLIATKCSNPSIKWADGADFDLGNSFDASKLVGFPIGYEAGKGNWSIEEAPGFPKGDEWRSHYALPNRKTYSRPDAPSMLVTYAETYLLLADATARGFISGGNAKAKEYFNIGTKAAMEQFSFYSAAKEEYETFLSPSNITKYVDSRSIVFDTNPLAEINWQYYITTFCDEYETFSNWRRSGYPELKSVYEAPYNRPTYPNSITSSIPRRFTYPVSEMQTNNNNYKEAVSKLSNGDKMDSRIWWDK